MATMSDWLYNVCMYVCDSVLLRMVKVEYLQVRMLGSAHIMYEVVALVMEVPKLNRVVAYKFYLRTTEKACIFKKKGTQIHVQLFIHTHKTFTYTNIHVHTRIPTHRHLHIYVCECACVR